MYLLFRPSGRTETALVPHGGRPVHGYMADRRSRDAFRFSGRRHRWDLLRRLLGVPRVDAGKSKLMALGPDHCGQAECFPYIFHDGGYESYAGPCHRGTFRPVGMGLDGSLGSEGSADGPFLDVWHASR